MRLGQSSRFRGASAGRFVGRDVVTCCAASCFKWSLYKDLAKDDPEAPGYVRSKLACPKLVSYFRSRSGVCLGQIVWVWEKLERQANEMLDTVIYASAAAYGRVQASAMPGKSRAK